MMDLDYDQLRDVKQRFFDCYKELETQRLQNRQSVHDRMLAVARAKESIKQDMQVDMEKVKSKMKEDFQQEIDKLQDTIRMQEEEIKQLRGERAEVLKLAKDNQGSERVERTIINEINEECRKNSHVLGISPRKVNMTDFRENGYNSPGRIRTPTTAALGNPPNGYKHHNDVRMQYTKSTPYEYGPRTTAQEQELERLEREIKRLTTTMRSPSPTPQQERIVNILEQRAKEADFESDTLLDQQQRSRNMMSQKMQEMTKLQTSLTTQTKDLIHLGQAYSKLNNSYRYGKT
ncbi:unnamed protein product [Mytilus edulis]|uniref:Uncharacterized protein n=1 Tax=Mytilus edulis TaxID=6550 RepID=A0A8S3QKQ8_MYTED|nr:unnamed protein product [Mytilus edulis]